MVERDSSGGDRNASLIILLTAVLATARLTGVGAGGDGEKSTWSSVGREGEGN